MSEHWAMPVEQALAAFIQTIPAETNPCGILAIASLLLRAHKGIFWIFRIRRQPIMICPHITISWTLAIALTAIFFEVYLSYLLKYFRRKFNPNFAFWYLTIWFFPFLSGWMAAWALSVSFIAHKQVTSQAPCRTPALVCNLLGPIVPLIYAGVALGFAIPTGIAYRRLMRALNTATQGLLARAAAWQPGDAVDMSSLDWVLPLFREQARQYNRFMAGFKRIFLFYGVAAVLLLCVVVSVVGLYFWSIRRSLNEARRASTAATTPATDKPRSSISRPQRRVRRQLLNLFFTFVLFSTLGLVFSVAAFVAAVRPNILFISVHHMEVVVFIPLYGYAIFGIPCMMLVLFGAYRAAPAPHRSRQERRLSAATPDPDPDSLPWAAYTMQYPPWVSARDRQASVAGEGAAIRETSSPRARAATLMQWFSRDEPPAASLQGASAVSYTVDVDVRVEEDDDDDAVDKGIARSPTESEAPPPV
ncbi:hypothetical protein JCM8202_004332 [Rhodotorula sphaerocarpa]